MTTNEHPGSTWENPRTAEEREKAALSFLPPEVPASTVAAVAGDKRAIIDALAEFGFQLVQEHGKRWETEFYNAVHTAVGKTMEKVADALRRDK